MTTIKAGYRFTVKTWENDGDYDNTEIVDGKTYDEACFIVDFLKPFMHSRWEGNQYIGNVYNANEYELDDIYRVMQEIVDRHPKVAEYMADKVVGGIFDAEAAWQMYGWPLGLLGQQDQWSRHVDNVIVEFIPEDIELKDVTKEFFNE